MMQMVGLVELGDVHGLHSALLEPLTQVRFGVYFYAGLVKSVGGFPIKVCAACSTEQSATLT